MSVYPPFSTARSNSRHKPITWEPHPQLEEFLELQRDYRLVRESEQCINGRVKDMRLEVSGDVFVTYTPHDNEWCDYHYKTTWAVKPLEDG